MPSLHDLRCLNTRYLNTLPLACWKTNVRRLAKGLRFLTAAGAISAAALGAEAQVQENTSIQGGAPQLAVQQQHPLVPALDLAYKTKKNMEANLHDYSATVVKQERIDGKLGEAQFAIIKVRQQPFSVYMSFIAPAELKGQECMYIEGVNDNKMWAHASPGTLRGKFGTVSLAPNSPMAMQGQHYPITELGIANLTKRLIEVGEHDKQYGECEVQFFQGAKVADRQCTVIQVTHPTPRRTFLFHQARIFLDDQLDMPIRYEAYDWPSQAGEAPPLIESYTYMNLKINEGLTDADFNVHNPAYQFNVKASAMTVGAAH